MARSLAEQLLGSVGRLAEDAMRTAARESSAISKRLAGQHRIESDDRGAPKLSSKYPGDYRGRPRVSYSPTIGGLPGTGEVVWAWVATADDTRRGKDKPVLLIGTDGDWFLGLEVATEQGPATQEWASIGTGAWAPRASETWARTDRIVRIHPDEVRGRAEKLDKPRFDGVATQARGR